MANLAIWQEVLDFYANLTDFTQKDVYLLKTL